MRKYLLMAAVAATVAGISGNALAGETKVSGKTYADASYKTNKDDATGTKTPDSGYGVDVKRFYIGIDHQIDDMWSASFVSDIGDNSVTVKNGPANLGGTSKRYDIFVKKAYIQAKFAPEAVLRIGSADMPWIPFDEGIYGYRYVENTLIDRLGFGTSADWGLHFLGEAGGGMVNYAVSAVNGKGYSDPSRSRSVDFEGRVGLQPIKGLNFALGGYAGRLGADTYTTPTPQQAKRWNVLAAYVNPNFRAGIEYFNAKNFSAARVASTTQDKADGYSVFGSANVTKQVALFARYDQAKPSKILNPGLKDQYTNMGLEYKPNKATNVALVWKHEEVKTGATGGSIGTTNGAIGSTAANSKGKYNEFGVWMQYAF